MSVVKRTVYGEGTELQGTVAYVRFRNFIVYSLLNVPDDAPVVGVHQAVMDRIESIEWHELFELPQPIFFEIETHASSDLQPGQFKFYRIEIGVADDDGRQLAGFIQYCPPKITELFKSCIGGENIEQMACQTSFDKYERRQEMQPTEEISWLSDIVRGFGMAAGVEKNTGNIVMGRVQNRQPRWTTIVYFPAAQMPNQDDHDNLNNIRRQAETGLIAYEQREEEHRQFLFAVAYPE